MAKYIYSTLSNDVVFNIFKKHEKGDIPQLADRILVNGKANIATKALITPKGALTRVDDKAYEALKSCKSFNKQVKKGFIAVEDKEIAVDKVAGNMKEKDKSAPLTPDKKGEVDGIKVHSGENVDVAV